MKRPIALFCAAAVVLAGVARATSAAPPADALALVPADAVAVGQIRFDRLKSSAVSAGLFHETDMISADGKAAGFLADAGLDPKTDVDSAVFSLTSAGTGETGPLVVFQGRFHPDALSAATVSRGAVRVDSAPFPYYRLPSRSAEHAHDSGAVAFVSSTIVIAGSEPALLHALDAYAAGTAGLPPHSFVSDALGRVDMHSAAWAIVDAAHIQKLHPPTAHEGGDGPAAQLAGALRSLSLVTFQADVSGSAVSISATGVTSDEETRQNLEDVLRGMLAAWRMSAQSKDPELVSAIRKITVSRTDDGVKISGDVPASAFAKHTLK
jgi:hypothetical protein